MSLAYTTEHLTRSECPFWYDCSDHAHAHSPTPTHNHKYIHTEAHAYAPGNSAVLQLTRRAFVISREACCSAALSVLLLLLLPSSACLQVHATPVHFAEAVCCQNAALCVLSGCRSAEAVFCQNAAVCQNAGVLKQCCVRMQLCNFQEGQPEPVCRGVFNVWKSTGTAQALSYKHKQSTPTSSSIGSLMLTRHRFWCAAASASDRSVAAAAVCATEVSGSIAAAAAWAPCFGAAASVCAADASCGRAVPPGLSSPLHACCSSATCAAGPCSRQG